MHITEIREGKATAIHLCETCARDYLEAPDNPAPSDPATELAAKLDELVKEGSDEIMAALICPVCGISFAEFRESGRFGCPADYTEFSAEILPLLENIHEDIRHIGKRPSSHFGGAEEQSKMIVLRKQQQAAIDKEDYETAARLRDEIQKLEASMCTPPASTAATRPKRGRPKSGPAAE